MPQVKEISKFWCDYCFIIKDGEKQYFSCNRGRDWELHKGIKKHMRNYLKEENNTKCVFCNEEMTKEAYEIHKKRNERLWTMKRAINPFLKCNRFKWSKDHRLFENYDAMIANKIAIDSTERKPVNYKKTGHVNSFSYLKKNEFKSIEEKEEDVTKELRDELASSERPDLEICECSGSKIYYFMENNEYSQSHLKKYNMVTCDCKYESD